MCKYIYIYECRTTRFCNTVYCTFSVKVGENIQIYLAQYTIIVKILTSIKVYKYIYIFLRIPR